MKEIQNTLKLEKERPEDGSCRNMVKAPANRRRCPIAFVLGIFVQWVGNVVVNCFFALVLNDIDIANASYQA